MRPGIREKIVFALRMAGSLMSFRCNGNKKSRDSKEDSI